MPVYHLMEMESHIFTGVLLSLWIFLLTSEFIVSYIVHGGEGWDGRGHSSLMYSQILMCMTIVKEAPDYDSGFNWQFYHLVYIVS